MGRGAARPHRKQAERRSATRGALLDATIDTLIDHGYRSTTTTRVVERAGLSRGAQVHHFPTKGVLVAEAVHHLAARRTEAAARVESALDRVRAAHSGPLFEAALELWIAGRTDPELRAHLVSVERELIASVAAELDDDPKKLEFALATIRGLALDDLLSLDDLGSEERWIAIRAQLARLLGGAQPTSS